MYKNCETKCNCYMLKLPKEIAYHKRDGMLFINTHWFESAAQFSTFAAKHFPNLNMEESA